MTARALVLDDEPLMAMTLARMIEGVGHAARATTDPEEFFELHASWRPSHVVLDLNMPAMDGLDVLERLARSQSDAVVILSSGVDPRVLEAAARVAADHGLRIVGVLSKPFNLATLRALLAQVPPARPLTAPPASPAADGSQPAVSVEDLRLALRSCDIAVAYQPKVRVADGAVAGFEALARWHHGRFGFVPPPTFIELAERHGLVDDLTDQVFEAALGWTSQLLGTARISLNVSALSVSDPRFAYRVREHCEQFALSPDRVILELTETSATRDPATVLRNLTQLRLQGFALSLDDFGTGYSSLSQLAHLPFSEIKVDKSFVAATTTSEEARNLVSSVIDLGRRLDLVTVAEGVEDQATWDLVAELGTDLVQGYFVSRPLTGDDARAWSDARSAERATHSATAAARSAAWAADSATAVATRVAP